jgi:hypothetical protein
MTDILAPSNLRIGLASERLTLQPRQLSKRATEVSSSERAEVTPHSSLALDHHEPFALTLELVNLHSFEEVGRRVVKNCREVCAKVAREIANGHDGAVDLAVVACEEKVHVCVVGDDRLIDGTVWGACCAAVVQGLFWSPSVRTVLAL